MAFPYRYTFICEETSAGTSLSASIQAGAGDWLLATVSTRSATTYPSDWTLLHETGAVALDQRMAFLCKRAETTGSYSIMITQTSSARIYINLIAVKDIDGFTYNAGTEHLYSATGTAFTVPRENPRSTVIWGCSSAYWNTSNIDKWLCGDISTPVISLDNTITQPRLGNFLDGDAGATRKFTKQASNAGVVIDCVAIVGKPSLYKPIEYVSLDGTQFIGLASLPINSDVELKTSTESTTSSEKCAFGYRGSSNAQSDLEIYYAGTQRSIWARGGTSYVTPTGTWDFTPGEIDTFNFRLLTARDDVRVGAYYATTSTSYRFIGKIHSLTISDSGGTAYIEIIPVRRLTDNAVGLYDTINDTFYVSQGTSAFVAGPDINHYVSSGTWEVALTNIRASTDVDETEIVWTPTTPEGTSVTVESKLDGDSYTQVANGGALPISHGADLSSRTLYIKITLTTTDELVTPSVSDLRIRIRDASDYESIELWLTPGNTNSFQNAYGDITLVYDGSGELAGEGGPVEAFEETFTPTGLTQKPNQNDAEHIELSLTAVGTLTHIYYTNAQELEHISFAVSVSGTLTHVDDL